MICRCSWCSCPKNLVWFILTGEGEKELGNPKNENHWKLTCPKHLPSHVDLHYLARVSTGEQQKVAMILVIGCVRILLRSQAWQHTNISTRVCFLHSTQKIVKKLLSSCSSSWDILPTTKLRLVNGCSDNPKPLLFSKHYEFLFLEALSLCGLT